MTDQEQAALEAAPEVVQTEANEQAEASEATESTEGQVETQPAEAEAEEKRSEAKARRERRKAELAKAKEEADRARRENDDLQRQIHELKAAQKPTPPKFEDFDSHDEYIAALSAYRAVEAIDDRRAQELERQAETRKRTVQDLERRQVQEARENWAAQADEARTRYADFDAVVTAPDVPINENMATILGMSDHGADVAYHLGTNKELAAQLAKMPVPELVGAMRILERVVSVQTPRPRTQTNAPEPVSPVRPKATGNKRPEDMNADEYAKWRAAGGSF